MKQFALLSALFFAHAVPLRAAHIVAVAASGKAFKATSYQANGEQYLDAKRVGDIYGGQVYWYPVSGRVQLSLRGRIIQFVIDSMKASASGRSFSMSAPLIVRAGKAFVPVSLLCSEAFERWSGFEAHYDDATHTLQVQFRATSSSAGAAAPSVAASAKTPKAPPAGSARPQRRIVVIDAGHGGKDPGATGRRGTQEKDITLAAALELAKVLRERGDFDVVLTRDNDTFVPLSERSKKANDLNADLFVSLHCNSAKNRHERGFEVYSVSETASDPEAERLAAVENSALKFEGKNPQDEMAKSILLAMTKTEMINESAPFAALVEREIGKCADIPDRGSKQAGFYVLRGTHAPAILVEMAFLSFSKEEAKLASRRFRRKVVEGVADGIADYARKKGWLE